MCFFCGTEAAQYIRTNNIWGDKLWPGQLACLTCRPSNAESNYKEQFIHISSPAAKPHIVRLMADRLKGGR